MTKPVREKWLDHVKIDPGDVDTMTAAGFGQQLTRCDFSEPLEIGELPQTNYELSAAVSVVEGLNVIREKCGLDKISLSPKRVHFVPQDEFKREIGEFRGIAGSGHAYIPSNRRARSPQFANILSHEMAHLSSFESVYIVLSTVDGQAQIVDFQQLRYGLHRIGSDGPEFVMLNEAVTEFVALLTRYEVSRGLGPFAKRCAATKDRVSDYISVFSLVLAVVKYLVEHRVRPEWTDNHLVWRDFIIDYWSGRDKVIKTIRESNPGLHEDLRLLGAKPQDIAAVATKNGLQLSQRG